MKNLKHYLLLGISLVFLFTGIILLDNVTQKNSQTIATKAMENECDYCINEPSCCADVQINHEAPCDWPIRGYCKPNTCAQIEGKGQRCGWYWIWHDEKATPGLGTNTPNGYGCMIGDSEATMHPRCGPQATPTVTPAVSPTADPVKEPPFVGCTLTNDWLCMCLQNGEYLHDCAPATSPPQVSYQKICKGDLNKAELQWRYDVSMGFTGKGDCCKGQNVCKPSPTAIPPTQPPQPILPTTPPSVPTSMMLPLPYLTKTVEPAQPTPDLFSQKNIHQNDQDRFSFSLPSLSLPKINLPCTNENTKLSIASANLIAQKPLGLFRNMFLTIRQLDKNIEKMINEGILTIVNKITQSGLRQLDQK